MEEIRKTREKNTFSAGPEKNGFKREKNGCCQKLSRRKYFVTKCHELSEVLAKQSSETDTKPKINQSEKF
jgi:hypothetical protein